MKKYTLGLYEKAMPIGLSWREKLSAAKASGFDFLEISIDETDEKLNRLYMSREERLDIVKLASGLDCPVKTMCLSGHRRYPLGSSDPDVYAKSLEIMEQALMLAADLGVRIIQLAGYDVYYEPSTPETVKRFEENLAKAVTMAAREGVVLGFETMETAFMDTVAKAMRFVSAINSPYLQVYPDAGNLKNASLLYNTDVLSDLESGRGHILAVHLKETKPGVYREVPFGAGHVDFNAIIEKSLSLGVRTFVTEFWHTGRKDWITELNEASDMMRPLISTKV